MAWRLMTCMPPITSVMWKRVGRSKRRWHRHACLLFLHAIFYYTTCEYTKFYCMNKYPFTVLHYVDFLLLCFFTVTPCSIMPVWDVPGTPVSLWGFIQLDLMVNSGTCNSLIESLCFGKSPSYFWWGITWCSPIPDMGMFFFHTWWPLDVKFWTLHYSYDHIYFYQTWYFLHINCTCWISAANIVSHEWPYLGIKWRYWSTDICKNEKSFYFCIYLLFICTLKRSWHLCWTGSTTPMLSVM